MRILKADDAAQVFVGVAMVADEVDSQDDVASASAIEKASWSWLRNGGAAGVDHAGGPVGRAVGSLFLSRDVQDQLGIDVAEQWLVAIHVPDRELFEELKASRPDLSVQGKATRRKIQ